MPPQQKLTPVPKLLQVKKLKADAELPSRAYANSAAYDLSAYLIKDSGRQSITTISPRTTAKIPTGLAMRPPDGYCLLICSRSGLATKSIMVANGPGVVDPDYTGEIQVLLFNGGLEPLYIKHGARIAQALLVPFGVFPLGEVTDFPITERGSRGFGSTGL